MPDDIIKDKELIREYYVWLYKVSAASSKLSGSGSKTDNSDDINANDDSTSNENDDNQSLESSSNREVEASNIAKTYNIGLSKAKDVFDDANFLISMYDRNGKSARDVDGYHIIYDKDGVFINRTMVWDCKDGDIDQDFLS